MWKLSLRQGPSSEIYKIAGVDGPGDLEESGHVTVLVGDLTSTFITVDVSLQNLTRVLIKMISRVFGKFLQ